MKSSKRRRTTVALLATVALVLPAPAVAAPLADAPGAPGTGAAWTTGGKEGFGTSADARSKVWFTLGQGVSHEIYYPTVDVANVQDLQYVVSDGAGFTQLERDHTTKQLVLTDPRSLSYRQINTSTDGRYRITKTHTADPARSTVLIQTRFEVLSGGPLQLYVLYNPSLNNSGMGDTGATSGGQLVASDGPVSSALAASTGFVKATSGYSGTASDGYVDLSGDHVLGTQYDTASTPGNLVQLGQIPVGTDTTFTLALGFGGDRGAASANASASLSGGFAAADSAYRSGWNGYLSSLAAVPRSITEAGLTTQYNVALMTLKAHEDKSYAGANVASLTNPWGEAKDANGTGDCGYHAVWSRDLYQVSTAQIAAGDSVAANRSVDYLFTVQQRPDGSFPQNTRLDGTNCWTSLQMDEVAFPIVLAWQLGRFDAGMWAKVKKSADFLVARGPSTPQERWEENGGYSPSTIAAEIAGLICAADIAERNGDTAAAAGYRGVADRWQAQVSAWTFTTSGPLGDGRYFHRIDGNGDPDDGQNVFLQNGGGNHDERAIIDAGFLDLVRLGVKPAADPDVAASLPEVDSTLKVNTPNGPMWYRYNHDGYGEPASGGPYTGAGIGRLWPLLTGERGEYELANGRQATTHLATMAASANPGHLIPEQVWDRPDAHGFKFGEGTGAATPLAWSMAQFVRLAHSIDAGAPVETPSVVKQRYANGCAGVSANFSVNATTTWGQNIFLVGDRAELGAWNPANAVPMSSANYPQWTTSVALPRGTAFQYKYIRKEGNTVTWESGANRTATASGGCTMALNDTWRP